jgi:hypothetical protein
MRSSVDSRLRRGCACVSTKPLSDSGRLRWAIPEGYVPSGSVDPNSPALLSHEDACLLNAPNRDAEVLTTLYFEDREPVGAYRVGLPARRTKHLRFNDLSTIAFAMD